jgi:ankyrin repeat protein
MGYFKILLEAGADPALKNEDGERALDLVPSLKRASFRAVLKNAGRRL